MTIITLVDDYYHSVCAFYTSTVQCTILDLLVFLFFHLQASVKTIRIMISICWSSPTRLIPIPPKAAASGKARCQYIRERTLLWTSMLTTASPFIRSQVTIIQIRQSKADYWKLKIGLNNRLLKLYIEFMYECKI